MTISKKKYAFWFALQAMKPWEAVAVTLRMDPDEVSSRNNFEDHEFPSQAKETEFRDRLRLLVSHLGNRAHFTTPADSGVKLAEVVTFLQKHERKPISKDLLKAMPTAAATEIATAAPPITTDQPWMKIARSRASALLQANPKWSTEAIALEIQKEFMRDGVKGTRKRGLAVETIRKALNRVPAAHERPKILGIQPTPKPTPKLNRKK